MLGNYSKFIAAIVGNAVAIGLVYLASKGLATCDTNQVCTIGGFTTAQITGAVMAVVNSYFVWQFPPNKPS